MNQQKVKGVFDTTPDDFMSRAGSLMGNPIFGMGMGLLQSKYDPQVNPFAAAVSGLKATREQQVKDKEAERLANHRREIENMMRMFAAQQGNNPYGNPMQAQTPQMSPANPFGMHTNFSPTQNLINQYSMDMWMKGGMK